MLKKVIAVATMIVSVCACHTSFAKEIAVFDIRRPLSFDNGVDLPKDFYINAGIEVGMKVGMTVTVNRRQTLYDPFQNKSPGDLIIPVGRLRIIHVQDNIAVARMEDMLSREALPTLDVDAIMVGDRLDMATAKMGSGKRAETEAPADAKEGDATSASVSSEPTSVVTPEITPAIVPEPSPIAAFALPTDGPTL